MISINAYVCSTFYVAYRVKIETFCQFIDGLMQLVQMLTVYFRRKEYKDERIGKKSANVATQTNKCSQSVRIRNKNTTTSMQKRRKKKTHKLAHIFAQ